MTPKEFATLTVARSRLRNALGQVRRVPSLPPIVAVHIQSAIDRVQEAIDADRK